ncbi:MAG: adenosine deaminase [Gemmatimonadota bacterium]
MIDPTPHPLDDRLVAMPKVELHVHLEGAQLPETIWAMARRNGVTLPAASLDEWRRFYAFRDFAHFIEVYIAASRAMVSAEDFRRLTVAFHAYQAAQHIVYTEAFLSASLFVERIPWPDLFHAFQDGLAEGRERHGVTVRFIPDIARNFPRSKARVLQFTLAGQHAGVFIGLGLGGIEAGFPAEGFSAEFAEARANGLHVVAHAGEGAGPESIRAALDALGAERIGHGIRCVDDPTLVAELRARQVPIEVCPISNYRTGVLAADAPHPILAMLDAGLNVTINSDDPPMFATSLTDEYRWMARQGVTWDRLHACTLAAVDASFASPEEKAMLRQHIQETP